MNPGSEGIAGPPILRGFGRVTQRGSISLRALTAQTEEASLWTVWTMWTVWADAQIVHRVHMVHTVHIVHRTEEAGKPPHVSIAYSHSIVPGGFEVMS